jgi:hypothetical protein
MIINYIEIDFDEKPCIIFFYNHILIIESINGHLNISNYYKFSDEFNQENLIIKLKFNSELFSIIELRNCPICRGLLRNINKYDRIIWRT